ncbi:hypothetical protein JQC92_02545 [Shewanella sp. 202IG2-18]|uniref:hypothetical protein n=1 Tax=Parashewanella hymeniacidonis TaxID=2807618 RepID=UPI0019602C3A|nr:hypothetical protein [Parashewanella hymeniacidonis]MBM7070921.1 hypothetical protein [Parashewanella hymeniacidonis]
MEAKTLPKKITDNPEYVEALRAFLKEKRKELGGYKAMYRLLYGVEPTVNEEKRLINLINRGALSGEFIGLCADKLSLNDVTLGEIYKLNQS